MENKEFNVGDAVKYVFDGEKYFVVATKTIGHKAPQREIFPNDGNDYVIGIANIPMSENGIPFKPYVHVPFQHIELWED